MVRRSDPGLFSVEIQDSLYTGSPKYDLLGDPEFSVVSGKYLFKFKLPKISGTDSFNTATNQNLKLEVHYDSIVWVANSSQGNAALKITHYDQVTKRAEATFSFTAVKTGEIDIVGTNGKLQFASLRR